MSRLERFGSSQYSSKEQEAIERALKARLGPNFISKRPVGGGSQASYLEGHRAVSLANEIFGFNGWSHSVTKETIDFVDHKEVCSVLNIIILSEFGILIFKTLSFTDQSRGELISNFNLHRLGQVLYWNLGHGEGTA